MMIEEGSSTPRSPEAKVGMQVEDLWDVQEPQLSPTEKLNACFESIPVSDFPPAPSSQVVEINSDSSLAEVVKLLAQHKILSAPVVDVKAPEDASWIDRYIGIVEFAGIVVSILHQSEKMDGSAALAFELFSESENGIGPAVAAAANGMSSPRYRSLHPESPTATSGDFFETLTSSDFYKNTKVGDISGSFRWAPFLALQKSNSFLTMLLLLSKYRMKSVPVVDPGEQKIDNIITQSAVIHMLEECAGLHWFESWGSKKLSELGLPLMKPSHIIKVYEDEPVLQAFKLMRQKGVGGIPVVASNGRKAIGNISIRDIQFLLLAPEIYKEFRSIMATHIHTHTPLFPPPLHFSFVNIRIKNKTKKNRKIKESEPETYQQNLCSPGMAGVLETLTVPRAASLPSASLAPIPGSPFSTSRIRFSEFRGLKIQSTRPSSSASLSSNARLARRGSRIVCEAQDTALVVPPVKDDTWQSLVLDCDSPVLVEFWAPWCGPCRIIHPVIDELAKEYAGKLKCYKVNTDDSPGIATKYGIRSIPTVMIFKNGEKKDAVIGAVPKQVLTTSIEKFL